MKVLIDKIVFDKNIQIILNSINADKIISVVKDNAYGHGLIKIAKWLHESGLDYYATNDVESAMLLRKVFPNAQIMILNRVPSFAFKDLVNNCIEIPICGTFELDCLESILRMNSMFLPKVKINIKLNLDLNRWGESIDIISKCLYEKKSNGFHKKIVIKGLFFQMSRTYSEKGLEYSELYKKTVKEAISIISDLGYNIESFHTKSTPDIINKLEPYEKIRIGAGIYGIPNRTIDNYPFQPIMKAYTYIVKIRKLKSNDSVGYYSHCYLCDGNHMVGVLPVGKAHGIDYDSSMYCKKIKVKVIYVYMDTTIVLIPKELVHNVREGDLVEIRIEKTSGRSCSDFTNQYGNSILNSTVYIE